MPCIRPSWTRWPVRPPYTVAFEWSLVTANQCSPFPHLPRTLLPDSKCFHQSYKRPVNPSRRNSWSRRSSPAGMTFCSFLDSWCKERKLAFTLRHSATSEKDEISPCPSGPVLPKYSPVQLFCTRNNCPAFIKLCPQKGKLVVSNTNFQHNHDLPETDLSPPLKRSKQVYTVGLPVQIANNISRKFLDPNDLSTLKRFRFGAFEDRCQLLKELDSLFFSDPEAKVKLVFEENKLQVKDIFLMTSSMQHIAQCSPGYLYVDFFSGFSLGFDLYTVLCEEKNVGWKACAYCIARKGTADNLRFIMVSLFQSIPILKSQVKYMTVSPKIQDPLDVEDLVPCALLRYCTPLVLELLFDKISHMNSAEEDQIKYFLHILAHTHSPTVYNQALNELKTACPAEAFQYYYETWHPCRKLWAEEYNSAQNTESSICAYVKSKHQILTAQMGISPSLHRCLQVVLDDSKTTLHITDSSQEYPSVPAVSPAVVQQKAEVLTSSLAEEETEDSSLERCEDLGISKRQVGRAPLEEQLERNEFHSWKDFCSFMDNWCKERKLTFAVRHSVTLTEEDISQDPWGREVAKSLKYSAVHMACSISTKRTKCPAVIKLRLGPQKDKLIVTNVILHHDHDLPETALLPEMKQCGLTTAKDFPTRLVNDISRKFLELSDLKRLQRFCSDAFEDRTQVLTELGSLIISDPGAKVRLVFVEDKGFVKNIFLMTSHMQDLAHRFAEHLYVDLLADFSPGFALYAIFCEEGMGWKVCAYCLARKGTSDSLRFLMVSMLQSIPKINIFVKYLTVSPEIEDPLDIAALVPYTSVRYCMSLVLELLYSKISHLDSIVEVQIKNILHDLAHSLSPSIYNHSLMKLIAVCPAEIFQYYYDTWHPRKELWVREQGTNQSAEDSICAFVKAKRLALMDRMGTSLSLHRCLQVVLSDSSLVLEDNKPFLAQEAGAATDSTPTSSQQGFLISSCLVRATEGSPLSDLAPPSLIPEDAIKQEYMETPMEAAPETGTPECPALPVSIPLLLMEKEVQESCTHGELLKMNTGLPSISSLPVQSIELKAQAHATLMEEQMEQNRFQSWEDLCTFLDTWCEEKKVRFSIHKSEALTAEDIRQYPGGSGRAWALKYSSVQLGCCSYNSKSCPAFIQLKLHPEEDKLIVAGTSLLHNHNLLAADVPRQIKRGRVMCPTCLPAQMANDISSKFLEPSDLKELLELHSAVFEERTHVLKALNGLFDSNPDAKVKLVFLEDKLLIKNIFLMTSNMQDIAQKFPGHLFVDIISSFSQGFDLYIVFCEEEGQAWKVCAYCFVRKGVADTLKFIMASMLQSIPSMKVQVKQIIVNPEILETVDLQALIPHALLRYCMPLVLEILYHKVSHLGAAAKAQVKTLLHILAHTRTLKVYNRCLNELKAACPAEIFQYYHETWHPRRKLWMVKGNRNLAAESSIGVSVYATHQALLDQVGSSPSLHHCLQVVLGDSKPVLTITEASQKACETIKEEQLEQTEFSSWDDFCSFLDSWCEDRMLLFRICQSAILTKEEVSQCPSGPGLAQRLKYSKVQLSCTRKSCPAFIKLQLCPHKEKLVVYNTSFQHNHDLPETDLSPPLKRSKLASTVGLPVQIANNISRKFLGPNDLSTLQRFRFGAFEDRYQVLKELASLFNFDPEAKVKLVFEENKLLVKDIFLMTSSMQQIARCFPGYLYIDFFSGFSPGFDLYTVLCEEENVGWKACAYCIARKGTADNLKFIVVSLFQCIPILNNQVKCMTVSPEIQDLLAIKDLVPHASLRYCTLLVLELLLHKISHMNSAEGTRIKDFLHILAHTHSPLAYNQALNGLKAACPAEAFQYYYETWHPCRKMWAEEYNSAPEAESSICAYVKSKHQILTAQMGISPSLHRCLQAVLDDSKTTLPVKDSSQEYPSGPAVISAITRQKVEVPAASLGKEQTEGSPPENCEDVNIPKRRHPDLQKCPTNMLAEKVVENTKELSQDGPRALSRTTLSGSHSRNYVGEAGPEEQLERNEFHSWKDFCSFFDNWCKERKLNFAIRRSTILTEEDISQDPRGSEVAKLLKYSIVHMICSIPTERKNCPAFIKLRLGPQKDKLIVAKAILRHNHDLPKTAPTHKMKQWQMMAPIDLSTRVVNDISRKFLEQCDLRRLQRLHAYAFEDRTQVLAELGSLFLSDPGAKVKLVFEDKRLVKNIFLMTSHMQDLAHRFAGHLYVDLLADFSPGFALYTIFCEEEGMGWKVCAYCLARKDGSDSLRFLMVSVLQSIPKLNTSVKHLTVSPEFEDPLDIEALMPYASVRYCMSLVLELLYSKLSHLDSIVQAQIKKHLLDLAHSLSPEIYSNTLRDLIAVCPADIFRYYSDTWHPRKKLWVREQGENQGAEDSICAFVKAKHLALKGRMGTSSSLHHCLQVVLSDSRTALEERETFLAQETAAATGIAPTGSQQTMRSDNL
ncbi:uncharacterized protein LOC115080769 isoform X2 [Rhinatrema bivittatum]|uniref:uncharacterized protein LOC115080769 isoform X2 n=1 Tax=Rhinatrema bivittatum TaxID=194408 RepID=UPI00112D7250|nr:uncharacterized protein LOC115080769 isoform X2 [Rhinatrema bivittatum]